MIAQASIERLTRLYALAGRLETEGRETVTSAELGRLLGLPAHTIRKDLSCVGGLDSGISGYNTAALLLKLSGFLGFEAPITACIVGLGRLGSSFLEYMETHPSNLILAAGFDSSINRLELLKTGIPLYPAYEISRRCREHEIGIAVLCVPEESAQQSMNRLVEGGISGILNFSSVRPAVPEHIQVEQVSLLDELRIVSSRTRFISKHKNKEFTHVSDSDTQQNRTGRTRSPAPGKV